MTEEMRKYELLYIHPGNLDDEGVKKVEDRLAEIAGRFGARIFYRDDWGVKPLAYRVKKYWKDVTSCCALRRRMSFCRNASVI